MDVLELLQSKEGVRCFTDGCSGAIKLALELQCEGGQETHRCSQIHPFSHLVASITCARPAEVPVASEDWVQCSSLAAPGCSRTHCDPPAVRLYDISMHVA